MVHQYKLGGYNIVIDANSGSVHSVDDVAYDIIGMYENADFDEICKEILPKYASENLTEQYKGIPVVYAGGVMSCSIIKNELSPFGAFADPEFSSDNAAGVSLMTYMKYYGLQ